MTAILRKPLCVLTLLALFVLLAASAPARAATISLTLESAPGVPLEGVRCYAFTESGSYIGLNDFTDHNGRVSFDLPDGDFKFRADYMRSRYWSDVFTVPDTLSATLTIPHQDVAVSVIKAYGSEQELGQGIRVYVFTEAGSYIGLNDYTDAEGRVSFSLPAQPFKVRADFQRQRYWSEPFTWEDSSVVIPMAEALVTVSGPGGPVEGVRVYAFNAAGSYLGLNDITDANGEVSFRVAAGTLKFRADAFGNRYWSDEKDLPSHQVTPVAVSLGGGTFSLTVESAPGVPLQGLRCYAFTESGSYIGLNDFTDHNGHVSFDLPDGDFKFRADYMRSRYWSDVFTVPDTLTATLTIPHQDVAVNVIKAYGSEQKLGQGIRVYVFTEAGSYIGLNDYTDADGRVSFSLPAQPFKVRADFQRQRYWSEPFTWEDSSVVIPMAEALVTVSGPGGPVEGVRVYAFTAAGSYLGLNDITDANGEVSFRVAAGTLKFRADAFGNRYWSDETDLAPHQVTPVAVSLGGGTFSLTVESAPGVPLEGVRCYAFTESGSYIGLNDYTDHNGHVSFDLPDGDFKFRADYMRSRYWSDVYTVPDTLTATLTIPHQDVSVTVNKAYGSEQELGQGVRVYVFTEAGSYIGLNDYTDAEGRVSFSLPAQPFKVRADFQRQRYWSEPFTWEDSSVVIPMAEALVTVSGPGGPVEGVRVYAFNAAGSYLGLNDITDANGEVSFRVAAGTLKFRADAFGNRYWSDETDLPSHQVTPVAINVEAEPTVLFSADPATIQTGESSTLSWSTEHADTASISPGLGSVPVSGTVTVSPIETTTYTITVTGPGGSISADATVTVTPAQPSVTLTADPETIYGGGTSVLTWDSSHAETAVMEPGIGSVNPSGWTTVSPAFTTSYTITVTGPGGSASASAAVTVTDPAPTVYISAAPLTIRPGEASVLSWSSTNANTASIEPEIGSVDVIGAVTVYPTVTTAYYITVTGPGGSAQDAVQVTVSSAPEDMDHGISEDEQEGGGGLVGETVRILNGNALDARTDVFIPSPNSMGLAFHAWYNSRSNDASDLGHGWSHTYSASLDPGFHIGGWNLLRILDETGRGHYFEETSSGVYTGVFHERTRVLEQAEGYVWYRLDGTRLCFNTTGRLLWKEDEKGNRLTLSYDGNGLLDTVIDQASGRGLGFVHNPDGTLNRITGPSTPAVPGGIWASYNYAGGNLIGVTYADGSGFTYFYNDPGDVHNLTEKRNLAGNLLNTWSYDSDDRVVGNFSVEGLGVNIAYTWESVVHVTDAYGTQRSYTLTNIGGRPRVASMSGIAGAPYREGDAVKWVYDEFMNLVEVGYANDAVTLYLDHDTRGNPGRVIRAWGSGMERTTLFTYHPSMSVPLTRIEASVLGPGFKVTTWDYDDDGDSEPNEFPTMLLHRIVEEGYTTDGSGSVVPFEYVTAFTYNARGQVLSMDGPRPGDMDTTTFSYDPSNGDLLEIVQPIIGSTMISSYDNAGRPGWVTDANGQSRSFQYDGRGRVVSVTNASDGSTASVGYNQAGTPSWVTDEDGITRTFSYDPDYGRLSRITDPEGSYIKYEYDTRGNRIRMSKHAPDNTRTFLMDWNYEHPYMQGRLWKEIQSNGSYTEYGYDVSGNISLIRDPEGNETVYAYDLLNRLSVVTQPGNAETSYNHDGLGNVIRVTDAEGHETAYAYDDLGRLVQTGSPDAGIQTYSYDPAGNLAQKTDALGNTVTYTYDALNRITNEYYPDPNLNVTYTYDQGYFGMGRMTGMSDQSGTQTLTYDARGRLTTLTSTILGRPFSFSQAYTPGGRVNTVTYPSGRTLNYTRDNVGRVEGLTTTHGTTTKTLLSNMTYDPFGNPKGMSTGAGANVDNHTGESGTIEIANPGSQMEMSYVFDDNRNLLSVTAPNAPWLNQSFSYDSHNRLTQAQGRYGNMSYTYDKTGNRQSRTMNTRQEAYSYAPGTNRIQGITGYNPTTFTMDAAGNVITMGDKTLVYNQRHRLIRVEQGGEVLGEYTYNALEQRVVKEVNGQKTIFLYNHNNRLIAEADESGTIKTEYLYRGKILMAKTDPATGSLYFYLNARLSTPIMMTDESNTLVWEAMYRPFGEASVNPHSTVVNNLRFPGQYYDEETGLHYNYHRYYDPRSGRYLRPDPIGQAGGINVFLYAGNNPVNSIVLIQGVKKFLEIRHFMLAPANKICYGYLQCL